MTYAIDIYRGTHAPLRNPFDYLLYIIMFPQLIAGPIVRFNTIADEITERKVKSEDFFFGLTRFIIGLSKKILIANTMGAFADPAFSNIEALGTMQVWLAILAYTFQIYFDFSGYSDMAIGIGRMIGFTFPENFNSPYISQSITEFWKRWHITLGKWFRDYLYIPLGGNRVTSSRMYYNLIFVFLISGFWHGASWNFIAWGGYHGIFLILDRVFLKKLLKRAGRMISIPFTFFVTIIGWVIFRIEDFSQISIFLHKLFIFKPSEIILREHIDILGTMAIAFFFSFVTISSLGKKMENYAYAPSLNFGKLVPHFIISLILLVLCLGSLAVSNFNPFIYFRF